MTKRASPTAKREQRRTSVAEHLLAGESYREISREIGVSVATVQRDVATIMQGWRDEYVGDADEHVSTDLRRIDVALLAIWEDVKAGALPAIDRMIKLLDQRAKYLGLYSPAKVQGEFSVTYLDQVREEDAVIAEYSEIVNEAAERILNPGSDPAAAMAPKTLPVGRGQD
jgi:hypothetical protein